MNTDPSHAQISEWLVPFVRGELDRARTEVVRAHIARCEPCRSEHDGVAALLEEAAALEPAERTRLRAGVARDLGLGPSEERDVIALRRPSIWQRFAPTLGAAALVAVAVIGGLVVSDDRPGDGLSVQDGPASGGAEGQRSGPRPAFHDFTATPHAAAVAGDAEMKEAETSDQRAYEPRRPRTRRAVARLLSAGELRPLGRRVPAFGRFAAAYDADDAQILAPAFLEELAGGSSEELRPVVTSCGRSVIDSSPHPVLPAYGALADIEGERALVLGFVWSPAGEGKLDRFMIWAWRPDDCRIPIAYQAGPVRG